MGRRKEKRKQRKRVTPAPLRDAPGSRPKAQTEEPRKRFVLEKLLGAGGMCEVHSALDLWRLEWSDKAPRVAVKQLLPELAENQQAQIALAQEFFTLRHLIHPGVVRVYDLHCGPAGVCFSMEMLEGISLHQAHADFPSGFGGAGLWMAVKLLETLKFLHSMGVVHADIKPSNLFIEPDKRLVLIDFNISQVAAKPGAACSPIAHGLRSKLKFPAYSLLHSSPERLKSGRPSMADDVYSASCTIYELIAGRHPFNRLSSVEAEQKNLTPAKPEGFTGIQWKTLLRGLSFSAAERPGADELWRAFSASSRLSRLITYITG